MPFPIQRLRRLRYDPLLRRLVRETRLDPSRLLLPLFVRPGRELRLPIASMPGHCQLSIDEMVKEVRECAELGLGGVLLFGIPETKDAVGSDALSDQGIVAQAVRAAKEAAGERLLVVTDLCFCEYTDHGHCGLLTQNPATGRMDVDNDATLENIGKQALVHARAGVDLIAPSGMIDGMVGVIRTVLDRERYEQLPILSYAVKYAGALYGPFREAAESSPKSGNRRSYQMDPAAAAEQAVHEVALDLEEGADLIMIKPASFYLDVIRLVHERFPGVPLAAYQVSGEFSMLKAAAERGWLDEREAVLESLTAITRAGAGTIVTYWAKEAARWIRESV